MRMAKDDVGGVLETDRVELSTRNSLIDFDIGRWEGDSLHLQSTNGLVRVTGELDADDWIQIETTNGAIETYRKCTAQNRLVLATTNARISSTSLIVAKETGELNLHTTNGAIVTTDLTSANDIVFRSTNNGLDIANAYARNSIQLITSNSHIKARIAGEKTVNARVVTSNSAVNLAMTREFQGEVDLDTSRSNRANLYDDKTELDTNQKNHKHGYRLSHDGGKLSVKTSNSHIDVTFDA
ncbi:hypothetical protein BC940DRAFT_249068 [Gongronella butleri]|nr:hypothetical protein BC940DRAFT_249068 [Gongronella butleri]